MEESCSGHKLWAKALEPHSWTRGTWPAASQSWMAPQCEIHLSTRSNSHDSSCSSTPRGVVRPQTAHPTPPLWAIVCPPAASAPREHLTHAGFSMLSAAHRVDGVNLQRAGEWRRLLDRLLTPQVHGPLNQSRLRFCIPQKHPLRVRAIHVCV